MMNARRILTGIDPAPLLRQIADHPELWNSDDCWFKPTAAYRPDNIVLLYNNQSGMNWAKPAFAILTEATAIAYRLFLAVSGFILARIGITRMRPGECLDPHEDTKECPALFERYQVPLSIGDGVAFIHDGVVLPMQAGEAWWFDKSITHSVENYSTEDRIAMIVEIRSAIWPLS